MIYGYVRVSTNNQIIENQKFEINEYIKNNKIEEEIIYIKEIKSGKYSYKERELGKYLKKIKEGDYLIVAELSRLGRNMLDIMDLLNYILKNKIILICIKENLIFDDSISSKVISFAFSLASEIERNLISQRVKEALELRKSQGIKLGRPKGASNKHYILDDSKKTILKMYKEGNSLYKICKKIKCNQSVLKRWMIRQEIIK